MAVVTTRALFFEENSRGKRAFARDHISGAGMQRDVVNTAYDSLFDRRNGRYRKK